MRFGHELIEVFQALLVLDEQDLMETVHRVGVHTLERAVQTERIFDSVCDKALRQVAKNGGEHFGIVHRSVVAEIAVAESFCDGVKTRVFEFRVVFAAERHGVNVGIIKRNAVSFAGGGDETGIESGVVRDKYAFSAEIQEALDRFRFLRGVGDHLVGYAGYLLYLFADALFGVAEGPELLGNVSVAELHGGNFGYSVVRHHRAGRFDIEYGKLARKRHLFFAEERIDDIIDEVVLDAVNHLDAVLFRRRRSRRI